MDIYPSEIRCYFVNINETRLTLDLIRDWADAIELLMPLLKDLLYNKDNFEYVDVKQTPYGSYKDIWYPKEEVWNKLWNYLCSTHNPRLRIDIDFNYVEIERDVVTFDLNRFTPGG